MKTKINLPAMMRSGIVTSVDEAAREVEIVWTTGATIPRVQFFGDDFEEELIVSPDAVRLDRLNNGAPLLNSHHGHNLDHIIGVVVEGTARIENGQGLARVKFSGREDVGPIWTDVKEGIIRNISVGYRIHRVEIEKREGSVDLWRVIDWEPLELSAVAIGADPGAHVRADNGKDVLNECIVSRNGTNHSEGTKAMSDPKNQAAGDKVSAQTTTTPADRSDAARDLAVQSSVPSPDANEIAASANVRAATIVGLCHRHGQQAKAEGFIASGKTLDQVRSEILDTLAATDDQTSRRSEPAVVNNSGARQAEYQSAISTALMYRASPGGATLPDDAREFVGMTMMELVRHEAAFRGQSLNGLTRMDIAGLGVLGRAGGGMTTSDFPAILANVANKTLRSAYDSTPRTFTGWARQASLNDFKPVKRTQLGGAPSLLKVPEGAEITRGAMEDGAESYQLSTYARIITITRQAVINDDLSALTRVPAAFGMAAADLESDIVYSILLDNPNMADGKALFVAAHGNLAAAATGVTQAGITAMRLAMAKQVGLEGRKISVRPRFLIVPDGDRFVEAQREVAAVTPRNTGDVNVYAGSMEVVAEARLIPASGAAPWFAVADPNRIDTVEFGYLAGQQGVYTETDVGFEVDGLSIKARHDFAAGAIDSRGVYKNIGI